MNGQSAAVVAHELTRSFGEFVAVDRVSFEVANGEIFGFLGPNGAGKTTTIKMLAGLLLPSSGHGSVVGFDIYRETEEIKRHIGYMSQLFSLYGDLTVDENIEFFSGLYSLTGSRRRERRDWVLEVACLQEQATHLTSELPLGFKQRLALGCAVLHEPPVLFLDEPTSGVDPLSRRRFWDLIDTLTRSGTTVFVSTHYMEEAENCDRLALMNRGKLIALDTPAELRAGMRDPLLELRTSDAPRAVEALREVPGALETALFGRSIHVAVSDEAGVQDTMVARLAERGIELYAIDNVVPSLEDAFVAQVRAAGGAPVE